MKSLQKRMGEDTMIHETFNKQNVFLPLQPNLELFAEHYVEKKERIPFHNIDVLFYQFQLSESGNEYFTAIPDGCIDIMFCCDSVRPLAQIYGSVNQSKHIFVKRGVHYFGVRLPAGCTVITKAIRIKEITDHDYLLTDILHKVGKHLQEQIAMATSFEERKQILLVSLDAIINVDHVYDEVVGYTLQRIYHSNGQFSLQKISDAIGYSDRYLRKQFEDHIGLSPKQYSKIVRFQKSLAMLQKSFSIDEIIFKNGYYDQAHMIKDFKYLCRSTPKQLTKLLTARQA